jgi:N-dimethylarginine dimethylaminohydrolase
MSEPQKQNFHNPQEIYNATIKLFGSHPKPAFESAERQVADWGRHWGCDNDVGQLRAVLMHRPGEEFSIIDPAKRIEEIGSYGDLEEGWYWQSETICSLAELQSQHDAFAEMLRSEGVEVIYLEGDIGNHIKSVYTRDSAFAIKGGVIVCRMAPKIRHGEEKFVTQTLGKLGVPIIRTVTGTGMIEGGSFAWINSKTAVVGRSIRVNDEAIEQVAEVLRRQGVELIVTDLNGYEIHIDGFFLMVDVDLAMVAPDGLSFTFLQKLKELKIRTIEINSDDDPWIINSLAVRPGRLMMPEGVSDRTRDKLDKLGVEIVVVPYSNIHNNGGGLHCSTCPLIRDSVD